MFFPVFFYQVSTTRVHHQSSFIRLISNFLGAFWTIGSHVNLLLESWVKYQVLYFGEAHSIESPVLHLFQLSCFQTHWYVISQHNIRIFEIGHYVNIP